MQMYVNHSTDTLAFIVVVVTDNSLLFRLKP